MSRSRAAVALLALFLAACPGDGPKDCTDGAACVPTNPCHEGRYACSSGSCVDTGTARPDATTCGQGQVCRSGDCVAACVGGASCVAGDGCQAGVLTCASPAATPVCSATSNLADGTVCGTGKLCRAGACTAATCTSGVDCQPVNPCAVGKTACATPFAEPSCGVSGSKPDGISCGGGHVCSGGACVPPTCVDGSACEPANPCSDGVLTCTSPTAPGACAPTTPKPEGTACGTGLVCHAATCITACVPEVACTLANPCQVGVTACASSTSPATCSAAGNKPDGTTCGAGLVCTGGACGEPPRIASVVLPDSATSVGMSVALEPLVVASGNPNLEMEWSVEPGSAGTFAVTRAAVGTYTPPSLPGKYRVRATSVADPTKSDAATVIVTGTPNAWRYVGVAPTKALCVTDERAFGLAWLGPGADTLAVNEYDPLRNVWISGTSGSPFYGKNALDGAGFLGWAGSFHVLGGTWDNYDLSARHDVNDVVRDVWTSAPTLPQARRAFGAAELGGRFYLVGGGVYATDHVTVVKTNTALSVSPSGEAMSLPPMRFARAAAGVAALGGRIYVAGGWGESGLPTPVVEAYDVGAGVWTDRAPMPSASTGGLVAMDGKLYAFGAGWGTVLEYDPETDAWSVRAARPASAGDRAFRVRDEIMVFGPNDGDALFAYVPNPPARFTATVGPRPFGITSDGVSVWVANSASATLTRLGVRDGRVLGTTQVGADPRGTIAYDGTHLWVTNTGSDTVSKVRASDGAVVGTYAVGTSPHGAAFDGTHVWIANYDSRTVSKLALDGAVVGTYPVPGSPNGVAFDGANLWVSNTREITQLTRDGSRIGAFTSVDDPYGVAFDGRSIWFANYGGNTIKKFNPVNLADMGTFTVGRAPLTVAPAGTSVWVTNTGDDTVTELRSADGATLCTLKTGRTPYGVAVIDGHPWVTSYGGSDVRRLF